MKRFTRRDSIKLGAGTLAGAALLGSGRAFAQFAASDVGRSVCPPPASGREAGPPRRNGASSKEGGEKCRS